VRLSLASSPSLTKSRDDKQLTSIQFELTKKEKSNAPTVNPTETIKHSEIFTKQPGIVAIPTIIVANEDKAGPLLDCGHF
jgi:hypothetical protein